MELSDNEILEIFKLCFSLDDLPVGFYLVRPDGRCLIANPVLRRLLRVPGDLSTENINSNDFYTEPSERERLLANIRSQAELGLDSPGDMIRMRFNGDEIFAEDFCLPLYHPQTRQVIAYYGCMIDRTKEMIAHRHEASLQEQVNELTMDIGRVLHANTSTLIMVKQNALDPILNLLCTEQGITLDEAHEMAEQEEPSLEKVVQKLLKTVYRLVEQVKPEQREKLLHPLRWDYFTQRAAMLETYQSDVLQMEARASYLRQVAADLVALAREMKSGVVARDLTREMERAALDLQRLTVITSLGQTMVAVVQMQPMLATLREFVTSGVREADQKYENIPVSALLDDAVSKLGEFASSRQVEIVRKDNFPGAEVYCQKREMERALGNLLHNAIKYSWSRSASRPPWVAVEVHRQANLVVIVFEDWGVAIPRDEIEQKELFRLGYRGRMAKDRHRLGTGIGLTDSQRVIEHQHKGRITIQSRPAAIHALNEDNPGYYDQPFITTVEVFLPLVRSK